jgi:hypothetical protein
MPGDVGQLAAVELARAVGVVHGTIEGVGACGADGSLTHLPLYFKSQELKRNGRVRYVILDARGTIKHTNYQAHQCD